MADESGQNNFLFSFAHDGARDCALHFCHQPNRRLIIDSGAFSVWTKNQQISLQEYISFCKAIRDMAACPVTFISLDVIPGRQDENLLPTVEQAEAASEQGWANYRAMRAAGLSAVPTFHQFDDPKWLFLMLGDTDRIALSPRKSGVSQELKLEWLATAFSQIGLDCKVHGLGVTSAEAMEKFPFDSVDNRAWLRGGEGDFRFFDGRRTVMLSQDDWRDPSCDKKWYDGADVASEARRTYCPPGTSDGNFHFMMRALHADTKHGSFITELWRQREVSDRAEPQDFEQLRTAEMLYKDFVACGDWRKVAQRTGLDDQYVGWAVNLCRETESWKRYMHGGVPLGQLADQLGWTMWDQQLTLRDFPSPTPR